MADRTSKKIFKYPGGFIRGKPYKYHETDPDDHVNVIVWGEIIYDPRIFIYKNGKKKTEFAIRYQRGGYIIVNIWGDTPAADEAAMMKARDRVIVFGTITRHDYRTKMGEKKETRFLNPHFIIPCDKLLDLMNVMIRVDNSPSIAKILDDDETDVFESAQDYYPQENDGNTADDDLFA